MDIQVRNFLVWIYLTISICLLQCTWADNISRGKPASQLGRWGRTGENEADKAVDGNTDQNLDHGSCAHPDGLDHNLDQSLRGRATWWSVDLSAGDTSKRFVIENVTIYFRSCCEDRIQGSKILVGNTSDVESHQPCASVSSRDHLQTLLCSPSTVASYLTIKHPTQASLGLCEVIVNGYQYQACSRGRWGQDCLLDCNCGGNNCNDITGECEVSVCSPGTFGKNCIGQCNCFDDADICDPGDGYCPSGCKAGYMNTNCSTPCTGFKFGKGCAFECKCQDFSEKCNPVTGGCPQSGCEDGYWGSNCSIPLPVINAQPIHTSKTETSVTIEFPVSTPRADEYRVEYAVDDGGFIQYMEGVTVPDTNKDRYTVTQDRLTAGTRYRVRVVPYLAGKRGGESDPLYITTNTPRTPYIRDAPRFLSSTPTSITVDFQASDPVADTYHAMYKAQGANDFTSGPEVSHVQGQTTYGLTLDRLRPDTEYTIKITPVTKGVEGVSSPVTYRRTKTLTIRSSPRERTSTATSITMEFQASDPVAESYRVMYRAQGARDFTTGPEVNHVQGQTTYVVTVDRLTPDTEYEIKITPVIQSMEGQSSPVAYIRTKPSPPGLPAIKERPQTRTTETTSITVEFQASDPVADTYRVMYRAQGATDFTEGPEVNHIQGQTTQTAKLDGLEAGTEYEIKIIPVKQGVEGPSSPNVRISTKSCNPGFFGKTCSGRCNCLESAVICSANNGYCPGGCKQGYTGTNCSIASPIHSPDPTTASTTLETTTTDDKPTGTPVTGRPDNSGMIAGIIVVILLVIIIVVAFLLYRRRKSGKPLPMSSRFGNLFTRLKPDKPGDAGNKPSAPEISGPVHIVGDHPEVVVVGGGDVSASPTPVPSVPPTPDPERRQTPDSPPIKIEEVVALPAIKLEDLSSYIKTKKNQADAFKEEFKKLPIGPTSKWECGNKPENRNKNRFLNIRAYDHSRVVLDVLPEDLHSDYINADYLSGYGGIEKVYVAAQGPKKGTVDDTWRLVWQTGSNRIVMVTNLVEGGRIKCEQYWPNKGTEEYGDMKVTLVSTDNYAAYLIRIFNVERGGDSRTIRQFHFTSWPDHGVPTVATELLEFRRRVKSFDKEATGPLVIHCSAGVGRTGTYIAVDYCLQQAREEHEINVFEITHQMRKQRVNMIQTLDQYIFVYDAIQEALVSGDTIITASEFRAEYGRLCRVDPQTKKTLLSQQFETLETLKTPPGDAKPLVALEVENIGKNRYKEIVPSNRYRPFLSSIVEGTTSYINAVYVDGFREKLAYLVTQMPLPHTVVDLWRLLHDHHSSTIVMLNSLDKSEKDVGVYWPEDTENTLNYGPLEVMMTAVDTENPHITIRDFKIVSTKTRRTPVVRQFQLNSWRKEDTYPESRRSLLELMDMIEKWQQQTGNGPVTIHDMNGVTRCGLFVATMYATEQLKVDQAVDVFGAVKQVRIPRPHFIEDIDQYKFVHEMVMEYMSGFGDYSNFS